MFIQQLNYADAERVQIRVKNVDGSGSITTGMGVAFPSAGASIDGISVVKATGALARGFCGVATQDIGVNGYGNVTVWGIVNSVQISNVGTSITITAGDQLIAGAVAGTFFSSVTGQGTSVQYYKYVTAGSTVAGDLSNAALSYVTGMVRAW